ncbi:MAG: methyltransferase domain-containing protein [Candidatus Caldarchaeum sp.]|uniref:Methyltransferase domain-containing protein n=1 Tax=Caldiarchaeum subterraneum TaxID=311458 RepID=A0A7J3VSE4_CALS0
MNIAEFLGKTSVGGRVLFVGKPDNVLALAEKLGLSEIYLADDDHEALAKAVESSSGVKITPVYTRVVERFVELPSSSFDAVVSLYVLERALNKRAFMTEARRVLRMGGKLIIVERLRTIFRRRGVRKNDLEKLLETAGFKTEFRKLGGGEAAVHLIKSGTG